MPLATSRAQVDQTSDIQNQDAIRQRRGWTDPADRQSSRFSRDLVNQNLEERQKFNRLGDRPSQLNVSHTTRLPAEFQEPLNERKKFSDEHQHKGAFEGLRDFASQKWDQLTHGHRQTERRDDDRFADARFDRFEQETQFERDGDEKDEKEWKDSQFDTFKLNDNRWRRTSPLEPTKRGSFQEREEKDQKGLWERMKEKGEEWKEDAKEWKDEHLHTRNHDTQRAFEQNRTWGDQRALRVQRGNERDPAQKWPGDDPLEQFEKKEVRTTQPGFEGLRQRDEDLARSTFRENRQFSQFANSRPVDQDIRARDSEEKGRKEKGLWERMKEKGEEWKEDAKEWKDDVAKKQNIQQTEKRQLLTQDSDVAKVDDLVRGAPYQRASAQGVWDDWWHRQEKYSQDWEKMKEEGHMFKMPEHKLHAALVRLPERIDPTTERASSAEEALSDHTDPFVEDGLIGLHEVEAADVLDANAQSGVRKFVTGKWRELTTNGRFEDTRAARVREWRERTSPRQPEQGWKRFDENGRFGSPTLRDANADLMSAEEFQAWDRYRVKLADAFHDNSGKQIESNQ